ncbi:hypothetical protein Pla144_24050 [Bythopirellula polymerisocia]|uniref:Uncharacterized protein n=1 Tax=Bythopirellula polymerisocia TaxID=2528003 RepID=A0A5C6CTA9_9BACT|nr:hypothetical protein Pla144_24050 [Bythopirellula polymerisocia]
MHDFFEREWKDLRERTRQTADYLVVPLKIFLLLEIGDARTSRSR